MHEGGTRICEHNACVTALHAGSCVSVNLSNQWADSVIINPKSCTRRGLPYYHLTKRRYMPEANVHTAISRSHMTMQALDTMNTAWPLKE